MAKPGKDAEIAIRKYSLKQEFDEKLDAIIQSAKSIDYLSEHSTGNQMEKAEKVLEYEKADLWKWIEEKIF